MTTVLQHNPYFIPSGSKDEFNVIIEIPKGSQNKYELDWETGLLMLDRVLYSSDMYPLNYGMVPSTKAEDGDALDVMVVMTNPVPPLTVVKCRAIGYLPMIDSGEKDTKILAVPVDDPRFKHVNSYKDLGDHNLAEIKDFMETYKRLQKKSIEVGEWVDAAEATEYVAKYLNNFTDPKNPPTL
jgi:inorganic pyrophosphatase